jgi:hypothetical protein
MSEGAAPVPVTDGVQMYLRQTKPWVRFMSVLMFISVGFLVIAALAMFVVGIAAGARGSNPFGGMIGGTVLALMYLVMAGVYVAPGVFLSRYAGAIGRFLGGGSTTDLEAALKHQRSFWRYAGILTLIGLVLSVVVVVIAVAAGLFAAMSR